jgi:hypothetical protein
MKGVLVAIALIGSVVVAPATASAQTTTTTTPATDPVSIDAFRAYGPSWTGGLDLAVGNVDGDALAEVVTGPGPGGGPHVRTFNVNADKTVTPGPEFFAYPAGFHGGVNVTIGDVDNDGTNEIITGAGPGGGPHVRVFNANGTPFKGNLGAFAYAQAFSGGVDVAAGDVDNDGADEIITGAGPGGGPHVRVFDVNATTGALTASATEFMAYPVGFHGGVRVASADLEANDSAAEIVTGAGPGGAPHVRVFNANGTPRAGWFAYSQAFGGGVDVGIANLANSSVPEIITGAGPGGGPHVIFWDQTGTSIFGYFAFEPTFSGGVVVGGGNVQNAANEKSGGEIVTGTFRQGNTVLGRRLNF